MKLNLSKIVEEVSGIVLRSGWKIVKIKKAETGTFYIDIVRSCKKEREWAVVRIATHNVAYPGWMVLYSVSPSEMSIDDLEIILELPFGKVGDIL